MFFTHHFSFYCDIGTNFAQVYYIQSNVLKHAASLDDACLELSLAVILVDVDGLLH